MGDLLMRRRGMIFASSHNNEWDYEWSYTNGIPMTEAGWKLITSGSGECSFGNSGQALSSATNNAYRCLRNPEQFNIPVGVMEVSFYVTGFNSGAGVQNIRLCLSNGTKGVQICTPSGTLRLMDNTRPQSGTSLGVNLIQDQIYTITLSLQNNIGSVSLDGVLLRSGINVDTILYSGNTSIWSQNADGNYIYIQSVRLKLNRI